MQPRLTYGTNHDLGAMEYASGPYLLFLFFWDPCSQRVVTFPYQPPWWLACALPHDGERLGSSLVAHPVAFTVWYWLGGLWGTFTFGRRHLNAT